MSIHLGPLGEPCGRYDADGVPQPPEKFPFDELLRQVLVQDEDEGEKQAKIAHPPRQEDQWWFEPMEKLRFAYGELENVVNLAKLVTSGDVSIRKMKKGNAGSKVSSNTKSEQLLLSLAAVSASLSSNASKLRDVIPKLASYGSEAIESPRYLGQFRQTWRLFPELSESGLGVGIRPSGIFHAYLGDASVVGTRVSPMERDVVIVKSENGPGYRLQSDTDIDGGSESERETVTKSFEKRLFNLFNRRVFNELCEEAVSKSKLPEEMSLLHLGVTMNDDDGQTEQLVLSLSNHLDSDSEPRTIVFDSKSKSGADDPVSLLTQRLVLRGSANVLQQVSNSQNHAKACRMVTKITDSLCLVCTGASMHWNHRGNSNSSNLMISFPGKHFQCIHVVDGRVTVDALSFPVKSSPNNKITGFSTLSVTNSSESELIAVLQNSHRIVLFNCLKEVLCTNLKLKRVQQLFSPFKSESESECKGDLLSLAVLLGVHTSCCDYCVMVATLSLSDSNSSNGNDFDNLQLNLCWYHSDDGDDDSDDLNVWLTHYRGRDKDVECVAESTEGVTVDTLSHVMRIVQCPKCAAAAS